MKKTIILVIFVLITVFAHAPQVFSGEKLIDYGFEDWTGDAETTPGYIFSTSHWDTHINGTEAVNGTCGGVSPYEGKHYFHQQHASILNPGDDPCLNPSDDPSSVNPHTLIDLTDYNAGKGMSEIFLFFRFQTNTEYGNMSGSYRTKWIELVGNTSVDGWAHFSSDGGINMLEETATSWHSKVPWPTGNPHGDGKWHSFAMYINIDTGEQSLWLDSTDWGNPTETRTYDFGSTTAFNYMVMSENFSSDTPERSCWVKFDDIQVWTGIPTAEETVDSLAPPGGLEVFTLTSN